MKILYWLLALFIPYTVQAMEINRLRQLLAHPPFQYNVSIRILPADSRDAPVLICCHGYGGSNYIADRIKSYALVEEHIVSFNFPDQAILQEGIPSLDKLTFGTIREVLPLLYIMKQCVIEGEQSAIYLYGFSAGGGAVVNALVALNTGRFDKELASIGITTQDKRQILTAVEKGYVILDSPLKSVEEIISLRGPSFELNLIAQRYRDNDMRPIDTVQRLNGLKLNILLYFQVPDEVIANIDDAEFARRLQEANSKGHTCVVYGKDGSHNSFHATLWKAYPQFINGKCP